MFARVVIAAALLVLAAAVAIVLERRRNVEPPTRDQYPVPRQLDRSEFPRPDAPWLVAIFSSTSCDSCATMTPKVRALESSDVATADVEFHEHRDLHARYAISGIPTTVVADSEGVVRAAWVGAASATDLWAAVAELRYPGSSPEPELGRDPLD
ncbi:MAG: thioredoxin family protein [Acidimicrobiia bacterium]